MLTTNSAPKHVLGKNCNGCRLMSDRLSMDVQLISIEFQFMFHWVLGGFPMDSRWGVDRFDPRCWVGFSVTLVLYRSRSISLCFSLRRWWGPMPALRSTIANLRSSIIRTSDSRGLPGLAGARPAIPPTIVYRTDTSSDFSKHVNRVI